MVYTEYVPKVNHVRKKTPKTQCPHTIGNEKYVISIKEKFVITSFSCKFYEFNHISFKAMCNILENNYSRPS